ncbi:hypothetical protein ABLE91_27260 [Aquabacter sp. CN5-332]|uniref:hypothetical protein n=1 Tax=Aquabacter sp. CN5-332 TaxID=3156608 RepID=UPI0032B48E8D
MLGYNPELAMGCVQQRINAMTTKLQQAIPNSVVLICPTDAAMDGVRQSEALAVPAAA